MFPANPAGQPSSLLKMRANSLRAYERTPSLRERMLAGVRVTGVWTPKA